MTAFILAAILITLGVFGLLMIPLIRTRNTVSYERRTQNIHYAKERLQELDEQLKNASISATDYEALKLEIESTLAHDIDIATSTTEPELAKPQRSNKFAVAILGLFIPIAAAGVYLVAGSPEALITKHSEQRPSAQQLAQLIAGVEKRLAENPTDLQGWKLIAKTYLSLGRYQDARNAYLSVLELDGEKATTYASLADATTLMTKGDINDQTYAYIQKALSLDANNQQALWLAGIADIQRGNDGSARRHWENLLGLLDGAPKQQQALREIMSESFVDIDNSVAIEGDNKKQNDLGNTPSLSVSVSLSPTLSELAAPQDFVFIFARAQQGPPAPLAVKRLRVSQLPISVTLKDSDAMMSQLSLSKFEDVVVSARISKSGRPIAQSGDLQSAVIATKNNNTETIELTISEIVD